MHRNHLFYLELIPLQSQFLPWHPEQPKMKKLQSNTSFFVPYCVLKQVWSTIGHKKTSPVGLVFHFVLGGERGIRTPGASQLNGFQDRRNRPLCHLSNALKTHVFSKSAAKVQQILDIRKFFCKKMVECLQFGILLVLFGTCLMVGILWQSFGVIC